ncbi:hypothetical protein UlMin_039030 [Ulmus minor]
MRGWKNLGLVETIYEEEYYELSSSSSCSSLSAAPSSPPTPLHSRVEKWSAATGRKTEVMIIVRGKGFHLHKDQLTSRSTYLKRQLTASVTEFTLSPPLNISAETFTLVADFCYGARLVVTPFNLASLRTAAELLEMTEADGDGDENLVQMTDSYFSRVVAVNSEYASIVFRSCLSLLPEAETAAFLLSRSVEALNLTDDGDGWIDWFDDVILTVSPDDFHIVAEAMQRRFNNHDVVYKIVDLYIHRHDGKITEEQKSHICSCVDCNKLSPLLLLEAVQNPIMPLRFIVRAMLVEQLNTRRCIISTTTTAVSAAGKHRRHHSGSDPTTLGALLQRDAAIRQASLLKTTLDATSLRIRSLEEELIGMKRLLIESEKRGRSITSDSGRSVSFHAGSGNRVEKEEKVGASSMRFRLIDNGNCRETSGGVTPSLTKKISERLVNGLKKAFGVGRSGKDNKVISTNVKVGNVVQI